MNKVSFVQSDKYITKDLWLAAFLKSKSFMPKLQQPQGNRTELLFCFDNSSQLRALAEQFFSGSVTVFLPKLRDEVKEIRRWLDDAKESQVN